MPTSTFFNLPEEKQRRVLDAAWEEFSRVELSAASVNRIVRSAGIPRGSFYQYFEGKEDLFTYLLREIGEEVLQWLKDMLERSGNLFDLSLAAYDQLCRPTDRLPRRQRQAVELLRRNLRMNWPALLNRFFSRVPPELATRFASQAGFRVFRRDDTAFCAEVVALCAVAVAAALIATNENPETQEQNRAQLALRLSIIQYGSMPQPEKSLRIS